MKNLSKKPIELSIHCNVLGGNVGTIVKISSASLPAILKELPTWKRYLRTYSGDWADLSATAAEGLSLRFGDMAEEGLTADWDSPEECQLMNMHCKLLVWLLHRLGKLGELVERGALDAATVTITPGFGIEGVNVTFRPVRNLVAFNDNIGLH